MRRIGLARRFSEQRAGARVTPAAIQHSVGIVVIEEEPVCSQAILKQRQSAFVVAFQMQSERECVCDEERVGMVLAEMYLARCQTALVYQQGAVVIATGAQDGGNGQISRL